MDINGTYLQHVTFHSDVKLKIFSTLSLKCV